MTDEMMTLRGMVEKAPDADVLREMLLAVKRAGDEPAVRATEVVRGSRGAGVAEAL